MAYGVVRTDNMYGTDVRAALVSIKYIVTSGSGSETVKTETAIENGNVLKAGGLMDGEREILEGSAVAANTPLSEVVLVASPELIYDERKKNLDDFINEAGKACRGYRLHSGDIFGLTKECFTGNTPAVGNIVELAAGTKLKAVASATSNTTTVGKIIAKEVAGRYTYYVVRVD
jgi:hypothetical protein